MKKVLLIGDSIRMGYCGFVKELLANEAEVFYPEDNCKFSQNVFVHLSWWKDLAGDPATVDVVHWNCGHWDMARWRGDDKPLNDPDAYAAMLRRIVEHMRKLMPRAKIVFALTTPIQSDAPPLANYRDNDDVRRYNAVARAVMDELGVPVNDLFGVLEGAPASLYADTCHLVEAGYRMLADKVAATIRAAFAPPTPADLLAVATAAAKAGSAHAARERARNHEANLIATHDVKLKLDVECQQVITRAILETFPDHAVLGEEDTEHATPPADAYEWIIDPIDGTVNFFHGSPYWCSSVAVRRNGVVLAGCVCAPDMKMLFQASCDGPALRNGEPCHVSATDTPTLAIVHMGADKAAKPDSQPFRFFNALTPLIQRSRICGAAALDICLVACGAADGYFEPGIYVWDMAAADLILRQAGGAGSVLREFGGHKLAYVASNGILHDFLRGTLDPCF